MKTRTPTQRFEKSFCHQLAVHFAALIFCLLVAPNAHSQTYLWSRADFATGPNPVAVVVRDFNGDGISDLASVNQGTNNSGFLPPGTVSIMLGKNDGTFGPKTDFEVGVAPAAIVSGDFNEDGKLDLAVTNSGGDTVSILAGGGDGTFDNEVEYPTGVSPAGMVMADFNGDGHLDLAVLGHPPCCVYSISPGTLTILLGRGDGTFKGTQKSIGDSPYAIVSGDFNGDLKLDLAVSNYGDNTVSVFLSNGDGTFNRIDSSAGSVPMGIAVADFDSDGNLDLITSNDFGTSSSLLKGLGDGTFQPPTSITSASGFTLLTASDVNGDGKADLLVSLPFNGLTEFGVFLGSGDGSFQPALMTVTSGWNSGFALEDINGDGHLDLVLPNMGQNSISVLLGKGDGTFGSRNDFALNSFPFGMAVGDFNNDGLPDVVVTDDSGFSLLLDKGGRSFAGARHFGVNISSAIPTAIAAADFNGDGKIDVAVGEGSLLISVFLGIGDGTFQTEVTTNVSFGDGRFVADDFNGDGKADLAVLETNSSFFPYTYSLLILQGNGDGTFQAPSTINLGKGCCTFGGVIVAGDFNNDGKRDLLVFSSGLNNTYLLLGNGNGTFQPPLLIFPGGNSMVAADFNGDGNLDVAANNTCNQLSVALGNGDGTFQSPIISMVNAGCLSQSPLISADFNGDGKLDLASPGSNPLTILAGKGDGTFSNLLIVGAGSYLPLPVAAADFNQDGTSDLAVSIPNQYKPAASFVSVFYTQPQLAFDPPQPKFEPVLVSTPGAAQTISLTNIGNSPLTVTDAVTSGDFAETNDCSAPLIPGGNCSLSLTFTPTAMGIRDGTLTITDNVPGSPQIIALTGTGVGPMATLSPTSLTFADQVVGTASEAQIVTLTNDGTVALEITGISVGGANGGDYTQTNTCGASVAAGANCTISVMFTPSAAGASSGTLTITDNAQGSPQSVALSGTGTDFAVAPEGGSSTSSSVTAGQTATFNLSFTGTAGFSGTAALSCSGAPALATCTINPSSLTLNGTTPANATVTIATTARGMVLPQNQLRLPSGENPALPASLPWLALILTIGLSGAAWRYREQMRTRWPVRLGLASTVLFVAMLAAVSMPGCGGSYNAPAQKQGTPAGTYTIDVTGTVTSGTKTTTHDIKLTLTVN